MLTREQRIENRDRARRGKAILDYYRNECDQGEPIETVAVDLLADLMHWGSRKRRHGLYDKFEVALDRARRHFEAEEIGA